MSCRGGGRGEHSEMGELCLGALNRLLAWLTHKNILTLFISSSLDQFSLARVSHLGILLTYFSSSPISVPFSAAMVVASTLAFLTASNKIKVSIKGQLVEMAMENKKHVGVNSEG